MEPGKAALFEIFNTWENTIPVASAVSKRLIKRAVFSTMTISFHLTAVGISYSVEQGILSLAEVETGMLYNDWHV